MQSRLRRFAFTLIELLVVIAIIAIIAALSMVVYGNVKKRSSSVICTSNLRTIGEAFSRFAGDHDGKFPAAYDKEAEDPEFAVWSATLVMGGYLPEPTDKSTAVFLCPFDPDAGDADSYTLRSYAYNVPEGDSDVVHPVRVVDASRTILLAEWYGKDPYFLPTGRPGWSEDGWSWRKSGGVYAHHPDGGSNVLFYDMHVDLVKAVPDLPHPSTNIKWSFEEADPPKQ
jgi:prepilin-type N-terminal cleavage/methylation domain-containing protein